MLHLDQVELIQDGAVVAPTDLIARAERVRHALRERPGRVLLSSPRADTILAALAGCWMAGAELLLLREVRQSTDPELLVWGIGGILSECLDFTSLDVDGRATEAALLLATSGTTGRPKIARHTAERLVAGIRCPAGGQQPRWLLTYHPASFAGQQVLLTVAVCGGALIAVSSVTVDACAQAALTHRPTHVSGTPTFWRALLMALGTDRVKLPLQQITLGGEAVDQGTLDLLRAAFPSASLAHIYASTEAGVVFSVKDGKQGFPADWLRDGVRDVRMRVRDGVLETRTPRVMRGYVGNSAGTAALSDGWIVTGDRVKEKDGRVVFLGRDDAMINVGGAKVRPEEVESVLSATPGVIDAHVYGIANPVTGQLVAADLVVVGAEPEAVKAAAVAAARSALDPYKVPRVVRLVENLELSETGKKGRNR